MGETDTHAEMLPGVPGSATCVQRFDDSLNSAIRITYRISLRSSSLREPRHPLLKVMNVLYKNNFSSKVFYSRVYCFVEKKLRRDNSCGYRKSLKERGEREPTSILW